MALVELEDVATDRPVRERDPISNSTRYNTNLIRSDKEWTKLRSNVKNTMLRDNEKVTICRVKSLVLIHRLPSCEYEDTEATLHDRIPGASDEV